MVDIPGGVVALVLAGDADGEHAQVERFLFQATEGTGRCARREAAVDRPHVFECDDERVGEPGGEVA